MVKWRCSSIPAPSRLPLHERSQTPLHKKLGGPQRRPTHCGKEKKSVAPTGEKDTIPRLTSPQAECNKRQYVHWLIWRTRQITSFGSVQFVKHRHIWLQTAASGTQWAGRSTGGKKKAQSETGVCSNPVYNHSLHYVPKKVEETGSLNRIQHKAKFQVLVVTCFAKSCGSACEFNKQEACVRTRAYVCACV